MLYTSTLSHSYDNETPLFEGLNISLNPSESIAILGVSGSGKSTLLHILSSFLKPLSGEVFYNNQSLYSLSSDEILKIRRYEFGMIFQNHYLFRGFTGADNLYVSHQLAGTQPELSLYEELGISHLLEYNSAVLSGGQQQRLSVARVLAKRPRIIFADEPTGNLDHNTAHLVMNILHNYINDSQASMVVVTHDEKIARRCTYAFRLEMGQLHLWN